LTPAPPRPLTSGGPGTKLDVDVKLVQISDTHLTHRGGAVNSNFDALVDLINDQLRPDVVVSTGDLGLLSPDSWDDRETARRLHHRIDAPLLVIPGNHDVGEPGLDPWAGFSVTSDRIMAFRAMFGADRWVHITGDWALVGLNSELLSSGLPEEQEQWAWLAGVEAAVGARPTILFSHKPLWPPVDNVTEFALSVSAPDRDRLLSLLAGVDLRATGSGHLHRYRNEELAGITVVSAPSTAFLVHAPPLGGLEQLGVVEYRCEGRRVRPRYLTLPDLDERVSADVGEVVAELTDLGMAPMIG
jgi:3',5'-cyclic AMP phosphodiesterase CpdA